MIYYPIKTLIKIGIKDILIITTPDDQVYFKRLLLNNDDFNVNFEFKVQNKPNGIAEAFIIGEKFIKSDDVCLILGDNLFFNSKIILNKKLKKGAKIFVKKVNNASRYGVLEGSDEKPLFIHEKPQKHISDNAVVGIYMFKSSVIKNSKSLKPSERGELEITDLNNFYIKNNDCEIFHLEENSFWFDSGTFETLFEASEFVMKYYKSNNMT